MSHFTDLQKYLLQLRMMKNDGYKPYQTKFYLFDLKTRLSNVLLKFLQNIFQLRKMSTQIIAFYVRRLVALTQFSIQYLQQLRIMEVASQQVVVVEEATQSDGNPFILFILFILTLALHYVIPLVGTIYAEKQARKWIAYWIILLLLNYILKPILGFCFGATGAAFLHLVLGAALLYLSNQEKADLLVETGDMAVQIGTQQYENIKEKVTAVLRQNKLIE